ncbi:MAG: hypothetical protein JO102_00590, partial [Elusimicrobia bacterium]|nr:hypothetical protein [Elusimicrobiota bacterium]
EMGYDSSNGFQNGLPIIQTPWVATNTATISVASINANTYNGIDEITDAQTQHYPRVISKTDNSWWGLYWIGELYPDGDFNTWVSSGNLPTGAGNYYRAGYAAKGFNFNPQKRTDKKGAASFFNGNSTGSGTNVFSHEYDDTNTATITSTGTLISGDFNYPLLGSMTAARPFSISLTTTDRRPPEWGTATYTALRTTLTNVETYYMPSGYSGDHFSSALIRAQFGTSCGNAVMNGLSPQGTFGAAQISKLCAINLIRAFMVLGAPAIATDKITQVPLVTISSPTATDSFVNPSTVSVQWSTIWKRWDGNAYTSGYPSNYSDATALTANVKYSNDNGKSWYFVQDNAATSPGVLDAAHALNSPYVWDVSAKPEGSYIIRVEVYRNTRSLHYTYHERQVYFFR